MTSPQIATPRRAFECQCGRPVFFRNDACLHCATPLGHDPELVLLRPLEPGSEPDTWRSMPVQGEDAQAPQRTYRRCGNHSTAAACNWLVPADEQPRNALCRGCRLVRTVPDTRVEGNAGLWAKVEEAKRAVVAQLFALGLPVRAKVSEDPERGVMFDLLRSPEHGPKVTTGHDDGLITLDIGEAHDAHREAMRPACTSRTGNSSGMSATSWVTTTGSALSNTATRWAAAASCSATSAATTPRP